MTDTGNQIGNQKEYADHCGVTKQAVNKWVKSEKITLRSDGLIDFCVADRERRENMDPAKMMQQAHIAEAARLAEVDQAGVSGDCVADADDLPLTEPVDTVAADGTGTAGTAGDAGGAAAETYSSARAERENYQAKIAKLEYERQLGKWLPRSEVEDAMVASARKIRQGLDAIVLWADELDAAARNGGVDGVRAILKTKLRALESAIAENLNLMADDHDDA